MRSSFVLPLQMPSKKFPLFLVCSIGVLMSGCSVSVAGSDLILGTTESNQPVKASEATQPASTSQIIIRFKPVFTTLAKTDCSASYLALASAQKGYRTAVRRVLFSSALVVAVLPAELEKPGAKPEQRGEYRPATNLTPVLSNSEVLAFVSYLAHQPAVDYVELDTKQQGTATRASEPISVVGPVAGSTAWVAGAVPIAQVAFRRACGAGLEEPHASR